MQLFLMFVVAFFLVSLHLVKEDTSNPYCLISNQKITMELNYDAIDYYTYEIQCNTLVSEIYLIDAIKKEDAVALLIDIKQQLENNGVKIMTHFTLNGQNLTNVMYANLNLGREGISYIGG